MCLLLDVDDIDRMFIMADGYREDEMQLRQRRSLLMEGFAASLRLPDTSMLNITHPPPSLDGRLESSDGVFLRLMALHKGRVMLARALRLLYPSPQAEARSMGVGPVRSPPLKLAWALLRNLRVLFTPGGLRAAPGAGSLSPPHPLPLCFPPLLSPPPPPPPPQTQPLWPQLQRLGLHASLATLTGTVCTASVSLLDALLLLLSLSNSGLRCNHSYASSDMYSCSRT